MTKFKADYTSQKVADRINRDVSSGKQFKITGTPTFIVNGTKIENPSSEEAFKTVLNDALKKAGVTALQN